MINSILFQHSEVRRKIWPLNTYVNGLMPMYTKVNPSITEVFFLATHVQLLYAPYSNSL